MALADDATELDVVIVGGGVAGLAAAKRLAGLRCLVIEAAAQPGGRVLSAVHANSHFELGAMFPSRQVCRWLEAENRQNSDGQAGRFVLEPGGTDVVVVAGGDVLRAASRQSLLAMAKDRPDLAAIRDALMAATHFAGVAAVNRHVTHMVEADPGRVHLAGGMSSLVDALATTSRVVTATTVTGLSVGVDGVSLTGYDVNGPCRWRARRVVLACGPDSSRTLLRDAGIVVAPYLENLHEQAAHVMVAEVRGLPVSLPGYIVFTEREDIGTVVFAGKSDGVCLVTAYSPGSGMAAATDVAVVSALRDALTEAGLKPAAEAISLLARRQWPIAAVLADDSALVHWSAGVVMPAATVALAGDYLYPGISHGVEPAFISGVQAGERVKAALVKFEAAGEDACAYVARTLATRLSRVLRGDTTDAMTAHSPWAMPRACGDVVAVAAAIAGLRAVAGRQHQTLIKDALGWLQSARSDGMWPYTLGALPTATDSALVSFFVPECEWLAYLPQYESPAGVVAQLHSAAHHGARVMQVDSGNAHWCDPDAFTSVLCAALRQRAGATSVAFAPAVTRRLLTASGGLFVANPFLWQLALAHALPVLAGEQASAARDALAGDLLTACAGRNAPGSFSPSLSTACAVIALAELKALSSTVAVSLTQALLQNLPGGEYPFCSSRLLTRRPRGLPFHAFGDVIVLPRGRYELTLYQDTHGMVGAGLWLMAWSCLVAAASDDYRVVDIGTESKTNNYGGHQAASVSAYCAGVLCEAVASTA